MSTVKHSDAVTEHGPMPDVPAWRVTVLRPDHAVAGEGILVDGRHVLTMSAVLREALLGAQPTPRSQLTLRFGTHEPVTVHAQLSETLTNDSSWVIALPEHPGHEPVELGTAGTGDAVWVSVGPGYPEPWLDARVDIERADGAVELATTSTLLVATTLGSVVDTDGRLIGLVTSSPGHKMIPAAPVVGPLVATLATPQSPGTPADPAAAPVVPVPAVATVADPTSDQPGPAQEPAAAPEHPAPAAEPPANVADAQPAGWHAVPRLAADAATVEDRLSRRRYVDAIVAFLRHRDTAPPLTIGVHGAWGTGKTSLMRMVREELDPGAGTDDALPLGLTGGRRSAVTNAEVVRAARRPPGDDEPAATVVDNDEIDGSDWRPTVWFNPWLYQNGDQVWAGLAYAIIGQVTERLPRGDRERFWLRLNMSRVDRESVRRGWYRIVVGRLLPMLAWWLLGLLVVSGVLLAATWLRPVWTGLLQHLVQWVGVGGVGAATLGAAGRWLWSRTRPAAQSFGKLLTPPSLVPEPASGQDALTPDPGYGGRLGFLHLVQTDMRRVLDLVASEDRPLVVFVDDLDRCSPGTVAQVIEAINLFLAGEFRNCVFVLAMEPAAVVAHVEAAYPDLRAATADDPRGLGWRFLAKIVQLSLRLPEPDPGSDLTAYVDHLLGNDPAPPPLPPDEQVTTGETVDVSQVSTLSGAMTPTRYPTVATVPGAEVARRRYRKRVEELTAAIRRSRPTGPDALRAAAVAAQRDVLERSGPLAPETLAAAERIFTESYSDRDARAAILAALPALGTGNPRELKRYVNLFRFYTFLAERERLRGAPAPDAPAVAKLAAFAIRWPYLVAMPGTGRPGLLPALEAATGDDEGWRAALAAAYPGLPDVTGTALRAFLADGPTVGAAGFRLL